MSNPIITPVVERRLPAFLKELYPKFVTFIKAYMEGLEASGNILDHINRFLDDHDTSNEEAAYWDEMLKDIGFKLKEDVKTVDKKLLALFIRDYFMSRGSAKSVEFLFKLLYNSNPKITYPRDQLAILSATKYQSFQFMYTRATDEQTFRKLRELAADFGLVGRGLTSGASCIVDNVDQYDGKTRLFISTTNTFLPHETIRLAGKDNFTTDVENIPVYTLKPTGSPKPIDNLNLKQGVVPISVDLLDSGHITGFNVVKRGKGYKVGDSVVDVQKIGVYGKVTEITPTGMIKVVKMTHAGIATASLPTLTVLSDEGTGALIEAIPDERLGRPLSVKVYAPVFEPFTRQDIMFDFKKQAIFITPRDWANQNHMVEHNAVLLDSYYWHQFAYQIESDIARPEYEHFIKDDDGPHPPGYELLSKLRIGLRMKIIEILKGNKMINSKMVGFLYASVIANLAQRQWSAWVSGEPYRIGDLVIHGDNVYIATSNGEAGHIPPTHTQGKASDGGLQWQFVQTVNAKLKSVSALYCALGNGGDPLETAYYAKRIAHSDIRMGKAYKKLEIGITAIAGTLYKTDDHRVFYCVEGGKVAFLPQPAAANTRTADGLVWRHVGDITSKDVEFITDEFLPMQIESDIIQTNEVTSARLLAQVGTFAQGEALRFETSTGAELAYEIDPSGRLTHYYISKPGHAYQPSTAVLMQANAKGSGAQAEAVIINGQVNSIIVKAGGTEYQQATVLIVGDGDGATATATVDQLGTITKIEPTTTGQNYTKANVIIIPGDHAALFELGLAPVAPAYMLKSMQPDALLLNVNLTTIPGYLEADARYDSVMILTNASAEQYLHLGDNAAHRLDKEHAIVLYAHKLSQAKQRAQGQNEKVLIAMTLD